MATNTKRKSMQEDDPYSVLGLERDASDAEVRSSYRKLALKYHPDKQRDPESRERANDDFAKLCAAYQQITNPPGSPPKRKGKRRSSSDRSPRKKRRSSKRRKSAKKNNENLHSSSRSIPKTSKSTRIRANSNSTNPPKSYSKEKSNNNHKRDTSFRANSNSTNPPKSYSKEKSNNNNKRDTSFRRSASPSASRERDSSPRHTSYKSEKPKSGRSITGGGGATTTTPSITSEKKFSFRDLFFTPKSHHRGRSRRRTTSTAEYTGGKKALPTRRKWSSFFFRFSATSTKSSYSSRIPSSRRTFTPTEDKVRKRDPSSRIRHLSSSPDPSTSGSPTVHHHSNTLNKHGLFVANKASKRNMGVKSSSLPLPKQQQQDDSIHSSFVRRKDPSRLRFSLFSHSRLSSNRVSGGGGSVRRETETPLSNRKVDGKSSLKPEVDDSGKISKQRKTQRRSSKKSKKLKSSTKLTEAVKSSSSPSSRPSSQRSKLGQAAGIGFETPKPSNAAASSSSSDTAIRPPLTPNAPPPIENNHSKKPTSTRGTTTPALTSKHKTSDSSHVTATTRSSTGTRETWYALPVPLTAKAIASLGRRRDGKGIVKMNSNYSYVTPSVATSETTPKRSNHSKKLSFSLSSKKTRLQVQQLHNKANRSKMTTDTGNDANNNNNNNNNNKSNGGVGVSFRLLSGNIARIRSDSSLTPSKASYSSKESFKYNKNSPGGSTYMNETIHSERGKVHKKTKVQDSIPLQHGQNDASLVSHLRTKEGGSTSRSKASFRSSGTTATVSTAGSRESLRSITTMTNLFAPSKIVSSQAAIMDDGGSRNETKEHQQQRRNKREPQQQQKKVVRIHENPKKRMESQSPRFISKSQESSTSKNRREGTINNNKPPTSYRDITKSSRSATLPRSGLAQHRSLSSPTLFTGTSSPQAQSISDIYQPISYVE